MRIGICSIQRNRGPWIREWILFHYLLGVRYFYIGIHKTNDNSVEILRQLTSHINIKIFHVSDTTCRAPQQDFYQYTLDRFQHEIDWMAFIDGDEFLFPTKLDTLQDALKFFLDKRYSALGVYWKCFGSGGHHTEPGGSILTNFKYRAPDDFLANRHIKSVVHTVLAPGTITSGSHLFDTPFGTFDELGRTIKGGFADLVPSYEHLRINHYVCQSRDYFLNVKRPQGASDRNLTSEDKLRSEAWWEAHDRNDIECHAIDRFIPGLIELDRSFSLGLVSEARAIDVRTPILRRLSFFMELMPEFKRQNLFSLLRLQGLGMSRLIGLGVKRIV